VTDDTKNERKMRTTKKATRENSEIRTGGGGDTLAFTVTHELVDDSYACFYATPVWSSLISTSPEIHLTDKKKRERENALQLTIRKSCILDPKSVHVPLQFFSGG